MPNLLCHDCPVLRHVRMFQANAAMTRRTLERDLRAHDARRLTWKERLSGKRRSEERKKRAGLTEALRRSKDNAAYCERLLSLIGED